MPGAFADAPGLTVALFERLAASVPAPERVPPVRLTVSLELRVAVPARAVVPALWL